jgi:hypothetical protein
MMKRATQISATHWCTVPISILGLHIEMRVFVGFGNRKGNREGLGRVVEGELNGVPDGSRNNRGSHPDRQIPVSAVPNVSALTLRLGPFMPKGPDAT